MPNNGNSAPRPRLRARTAIAGLAAAAAAVSLLAACGGSEEEPPGDAGADENVEVTVWVAREQYLPTDEFYTSLKELYPNITVTAELQADDALYNQMERMLSAGQELPDLVQVDSFYAIPMYESGLGLDMTDLVARWQTEDSELYDKQAPAMFFEFEDKVVGLGTTGSMDVIYYRADWLDEAGFEAPVTSWEDLLDGLRAIKENHPDIYPWSMIATRGEGVNYLITQMTAMGVEFEEAVPQLDTDAGHRVIDFYKTLVNEELVSTDVLAWGEDEARGAWIGGNAAMMIDGIRSSNDIGNAIQDGLGVMFPDGWRMMLLPITGAEPGTEGDHLTATRTFHITSTSEHPYEASLVLRHMVETDQALEAAKAGAMYLQREVLATPEFAETYPFVEEDQIEAFAEGVLFPSDDKFFAVVEQLELMVQDIIANSSEPTEDLAQTWQQNLDAAVAD